MKRALKVDGCSVRLVQPDDWDGAKALILAHGAGQSMDSEFMSFFHTGAAGMGFLSVKFNFSYMEQGRRAPDSQKKLRETFTHVIRRVEAEYSPSGLIVGGKSMGGRVSSYIAGDIEVVKGLLFLGYPLHPPGQPERLRDEHLYTLHKPMLFVSGTRDSLARRDLLEPVVQRMPDWATLHWIEGGDHSFKVRRSDSDSLSEALEAFRVWSEHL